MQQECGEARLADRSAAHDARQQRLARSESEFATDQVHHSGALRGGEHDARLGRVACERFLTKHVLALGDRLQHKRRVRVRRRGDRHRLDARDRRCISQAGERVRNLEPLGARRGLGGVAPHESVHFETRRAQGAHVGKAAETRANDGCTDGHAGIPAAFATIDSIVY